jgi:hypothetical protein
MANGLPPSHPEQDGSNKSAENGPTQEVQSKPENDFDIAEHLRAFYRRLSTGEWLGFAVDAYVILWVWSDIITCTSPKRLVFLCVSLYIAHAVACYYLFKLFNRFKLVAAIWIVLFILATAVAVNNSIPIPEPEPHFVFSLRDLDKPEPILLLTNDFLPGVIWTYGISNQIDVFGMLVIPTEPGQSVIRLRFGVDNDSEVKSDDSDIIVTLPTNCDFIARMGWNRVDGTRPEQQAWGYREKPIRAHWGINFHDIELRNVWPLFGTNEYPTWMNIMIDPQNGKAQGISFGIAVCGNKIWKTNDLRRPIMVKLKPMPNGGKDLSLTPQELERLQQ